MTTEWIIIGIITAVYLAFVFVHIKNCRQDNTWPGDDNDEGSGKVTCGVCGNFKKVCDKQGCPFKTGDGGRKVDTGGFKNVLRKPVNTPDFTL